MAVGLLVIAAAGFVAQRWSTRSSASPAAGLTLEVERFEVRGPADGGLGDSLTVALLTALSGYPDLRVVPAGTNRGIAGAVRLSGMATSAGAGLRLELRTTSGPSAPVAAVAPTRDGWPALVRQVADSFLAEVWRGTLVSDQWLPLKALPRTGDGLSRWHAAERLYAEARWEDARDAYARAEAVDSSCILCTYRRIDIDRWLGTEPDPERLFSRLNRHLDVFPPPYRAIIDAQQRPWPARFDSLRAIADRYQGFFLASFLLGDELFHRGPLYGHLRHEAVEPLQHALDLRPDFSPGWEHLAWVLLSEGTAADARRALDSVPPQRAAPGLAREIRMMLELGYLWRFDSAAAAAATSAALEMPQVADDYRTMSGGRMMMTVDAPAGAVELGGRLAAWRGKPEAVRSGLLAQAYGFAALGRMDSLRAVGLRLRRSASTHALALYALELEAVLTLADPDDSVPADPGLLAGLRTYATIGSESDSLAERATWMLALLSVRAGDFAEAATYRGRLSAGTLRSTLRDEVDILAFLAHGDTARADSLLQRLPRSNIARMAAVPAEDALRRLLHSSWLERTGAGRQAEAELRWPEHLQVIGFATGDPQPGEAAWALGTVLRWRRARMLDARGAADPELYANYLAVARLWSGGEPRFAVRAGTARRRAAELKCESST
jgi:hypothetical protein